jgi:hypothetical protein
MEKALPHSIEILVREYVEQVIEVCKLDVVPLACRGCLVTSSHLRQQLVATTKNYTQNLGAVKCKFN